MEIEKELQPQLDEANETGVDLGAKGPTRS